MTSTHYIKIDQKKPSRYKNLTMYQKLRTEFLGFELILNTRETSVLLLHIKKKAHCWKSVRMSESSVSTITKRINHLENWKTKDQMKQNKNWVIIMTIGIKHQVRLRKKIFMSLDQCKQHFWQQTANHSLPQKRTTLH